MKERKIIFIVIDGLGDEKIPQLKDKTPLEAAKTPNLDRLAKEGSCGEIKVYYEKGKNPTSEETHFALFGYLPKNYNPGRGVLELLGLKTKILPSDVCLRGNFATLKNGKIIDRRAGRIGKTESLIKALSKIKIKGVKIILKKGLSHRIGIILRGKGLSCLIKGNDKKKLNVKPCKIKAKTKKAQFTANVLQEFLEKAHQILKNHPLNKKREKLGKLPANYILVRGAGSFKKIKSFEKKYKLKACLIAGAPLYKGIGRYLGMKEIKVKGATGLANTNLKGKFSQARKALKKYDFVFLHIKATDSFAEDGDFEGKKNFIEKIDKNIKYLFLKNFKKENFLLVITGDHSTCSLKKAHCKNPVPFLILGDRRDKVNVFNEVSCRKGFFGKISQIKLMEIILDLLEKN